MFSSRIFLLNPEKEEQEQEQEEMNFSLICSWFCLSDHVSLKQLSNEHLHLKKKEEEEEKGKRRKK